jgi:glycosyltransferase involved in cell wall biosynthesis
MIPDNYTTNTQPFSENTTTLQGKDIVIISIQPWYYELGSNCKNIAAQLAKTNRVLYVNIPITRKTFYSGNKTKGVDHHCDIIKNKRENIEQISEQMWQFYPTTLIESINWLPHTSLFKPINLINNKRFAGDIKKAIELLNYKNIILFNDNDIYNGFHLKKLIKPDLYIYYMRDFLQGYDFCKRHTTVLEPDLIKESDMVVTNSTFYADYCRKFNKNSYYIGQGCNFELFKIENTEPAPKEMLKMKRPIIGYVGALDSTRLDHSIIKTIASANSDWQVILVGPEDDNFRKSDLHQYSNIHFAGRKDIKELPAYIQQFDVCINPQLINIVTTGNYPLKIDEYLALGKPTVATRTKAMELFEEYTYLADKPEEYPALISRSIVENTRAKEVSRIEFARKHTWENSVSELCRRIITSKPLLEKKN